MALAQEKLYTIDDIYALPDGERAELIEGELYMMTPPGTTHQRIASFLHWAIRNYIQEQNGDCEIFPAPFAVFLNNDEHTYVEPDISVICDKSKLDEKGCNGAPDWVIEIVSPSSKRMDYFIKLFKYQKAGVREYWIVDPGVQGSSSRLHRGAGCRRGKPLPALPQEAAAFADALPDALFRKIVAVIRIAVPYTGMIISTRESPAMRREAFQIEL